MSESNNEPLALGTKFSIDLEALSNNKSPSTVDQLITALESSSTLAELAFDFSRFKPTTEDNRRIVAPLCRSIANLRLQNEHHPLKKMEIRWVEWKRSQDGMRLGAFNQFLVAAKHFGISHLTLHNVLFTIPVQFILEFCRDNGLLRGLEMNNVHLFDSTEPVSWWSTDRSQGSSVALPHLDKLLLQSVWFHTSAAAASFGNFLAQLSVPVVELGGLRTDDHNNIECKRVLSEFKIPSAVEQLTMGEALSLDYIKAALKDATATVTDLTVVTFCVYKKDIPSRDKILENLTRLIQGTAKLQSLTLKERYYEQLILPSQMIKAIEGCATITQFSVIHDVRSDLDRPPSPEIRRALARNNELARFVASPSTYPTHRLPSLILQFNEYPAGRFMLARGLPEMLSFDDLVIRSKDSLA